MSEGSLRYYKGSTEGSECKKNPYSSEQLAYTMCVRQTIPSTFYFDPLQIHRHAHRQIDRQTHTNHIKHTDTNDTTDKQRHLQNERQEQTARWSLKEKYRNGTNYHYISWPSRVNLDTEILLLQCPCVCITAYICVRVCVCVCVCIHSVVFVCVRCIHVHKVYSECKMG